MDRPATRGWTPRIPWGLLGCLLATAGIERFVTKHEYMLSTSQSGIAKMVSRAAREEAPDCEILCLGDSLVKFGAIPRVFEDRLGRPTLNLALVGGQPPGPYYILRRALEHGAHPAAIVVDYKANIIGATPHMNKRQWVEMLTYLECADMAFFERDSSYFASLALAKLLPSYNTRDEIRKWFLTSFAGLPSRGFEEVAPFLRNNRMNKGALVIDEDFVLGLPAQEALNKAYFPEHWDIDPLNARYMRRFLELAQAHKIPVFWVLPPIRVDYQAGRDKRRLDDLYLRRAHALFTRFPNLYLLDARHSGFPDAVFFDPSHLDRAGGQALSAAVARVIGSVLDGGGNACPRVVELPPYRAFALETPPEDLESSRERLGFSRMQPKR